MIFDGHGDVWTDVTCRAVDHGERDIFRKHHLHKFQEGGVTAVSYTHLTLPTILRV